MSSRLGADFIAVGFGCDDASASNVLMRDCTPMETSGLVIGVSFLLVAERSLEVVEVGETVLGAVEDNENDAVI